MSGDDPRQPDETPLTGKELEALEAFRASASPRASETTRARARAAFVQGSAGSPVAPPMRRVTRNRWPFAAAAAVVATLLLYGSMPQSSWQLARVHDPDGDLRGVAGRNTGAVLGAGFVETPEHGEFDLTLGDALHLRMMPCTGIRLPSPPRRWLAADVRVEVERGEVYGSTGGRPVTLEFTTAQATARITGTTFAVFLTEDGTCVCLLDGHVEVIRKDHGTPTLLPEASKCIVYADGRPTVILPIDDMERGKLQMLRDTASQP